MTLMGLPIGYLVILASREMVSLYNGETWPNRIIGFSLGVIVFSIMAWVILKEPMTTKTLICLSLSFVILLIQLFWK
jgi:type IV secretory pathway VirB3-like protein